MVTKQLLLDATPLKMKTKQTRCKTKPDCSPPGYPHRRLLIMVNWPVIGSSASSAALALLVISRRTRVSMKMSIPREAVSVPRCIGVVNRNRRRSTSCIAPTTVERVVAECTKFITHW